MFIANYIYIYIIRMSWIWSAYYCIYISHIYTYEFHYQLNQLFSRSLFAWLPKVKLSTLAKYKIHYTIHSIWYTSYNVRRTLYNALYVLCILQTVYQCTYWSISTICLLGYISISRYCIIMCSSTKRSTL